MKTALVTGGGRGIGASICERLAREGYRVYINYNESETAAGKLADRLLAEGLDGGGSVCGLCSGCVRQSVYTPADRRVVCERGKGAPPLRG